MTNHNSPSHQLCVEVDSEKVTINEECIISDYEYYKNTVEKLKDKVIVKPLKLNFTFKTLTNVPRTGLMVVGLGGNNGSTLTASIIANKKNLTWHTKDGLKSANYFGSSVLSSTVKLGTDIETGKEHYQRMFDLLPMVHPNNLIIGGWDINSANLKVAMERAKVLDYDLQVQLNEEMSKITPLPSIYYPDYIALNQKDRANNVLKGTKQENMEQIMKDIEIFKKENTLDKAIVVWSANTERYSEIIEGVNDTAQNLLNSIKSNHPEVSPSTIFAVACVLTQTPFINGSPQNTFVPGVIQLANQYKTHIGGDDFKSGQTKLKSVLVDFLVNAGIKPLAITSYNHLGNNDGKNLSAPEQFRSKEISKSTVVDDMVAANNILYRKGQHPDHTIVIKYVPNVGDSKRAMDEYVSEIFMGGQNILSIYNLCEDSLLASPLIIDLVLITELMTRVEYKTPEMSNFSPFNSVLSILSYMLKAPLVPHNTPIVNSLSRQRLALENLFRALIGLQPESEILLEYKAF